MKPIDIDMTRCDNKMRFTFIDCCKCGKRRKVVVNTPRHEEKVCGECYNWNETKGG